MKKILSRILICAFLFLSSTSAQAYSVSFQNWGFNPDGNTIISPIDEMTLLGTTLNNSTPESTGHGTFKTFSAFQATSFQNDQQVIIGSGINTLYQITFVMDTTGRYDVNPNGINDLIFQNGSLDMYLDTTMDYGDNTDGSPNPFFGADNGTLIASFDLLSGTGIMDYSTSPADGRTNLEFGANYLALDYWFDSDGNDMSLYGNDPLIIGLVDSNNMVFSPPANALDEFIEHSDLTYGTVGVDPKMETFITSNGSYAPASSTTIPEPATLLLLGFGLLGLSKIQRKEFNDIC